MIGLYSFSSNIQSQRQRELEEARARASQMEKTMKWWYVLCFIYVQNERKK